MTTSKAEQQMLQRVSRVLGDSDGDRRLCLLSLDGGGVRGLSSLYILQKIMVRANAERQKRGQEAVKPCQVFDLIGGTSTGGLIAILLGRLEMDVDDCIALYKRLMETAFGRNQRILPIRLATGAMQNGFSQEPLRAAIVDVLQAKGIPEDQLYDDGQHRNCRTFVLATRWESANTVVIRDFTELGETNGDKLTIVEAALATSAASSVFPPLEALGKRYVDGALGQNNPIDFVWQVALDVWAGDNGVTELSNRINTVLSIGTGKPGFEAIKKSAWGFVTETLERLAAETESTANKFQKGNRHLCPEEGEQKYYRFNVQHGLETVGIEEYKKLNLIEVATSEYLTDDQRRKYELNRCSKRIASKELIEPASFCFQLQSATLFMKEEDTISFNECIESLLCRETEKRPNELPWYKRREQTIGQAHDGTLGWLWEASTDLYDWMTDNHGIFWIRGKEGTGKSVAMKHLFNRYKKEHPHEVVIGFFFSKLGGDLEQCLEGLLRFVLFRLLRDRPHLFTCIKDLYHSLIPFCSHYNGKAGNVVDWSQPELEEALELIINTSQFSTDIVLFVDAINECRDMDEDKLIQAFRGYSKERSNINLKVCFCSVTNTNTEEELHLSSPGLVIQDETGGDLELYVRKYFEEAISTSQFNEDDLAEIRANVLEKADGCWLWVEHAVSIVNKKSSTLEDVKKRLEDLPKDMETLYETFLNNVHEEHAEETNNILSIMLAMSVLDNAPSFYLDDFRYILGFLCERGYHSQASVQRNDSFMSTNAVLRSRIQERVRHLLIVQNMDDEDSIMDDSEAHKKDRNGTVQLYHSTVKDFLYRRKANEKSSILTGEELERKGLHILTKACIRFLQSTEVTKLERDLDWYGVNYLETVEDATDLFQRLPLLQLTYGTFILASLEAIQRDAPNAKQLKEFWTDQRFEGWKLANNILQRRQVFEQEDTLLGLCVVHDYDVFARYLIEQQRADPLELIPDFGTYLGLAADAGSEKCLNMLLDLNDNVGIDFCSRLGTPITIAAAEGHKNIVEILLDRGADTDIVGGLHVDPLVAAASSLSFDIVQLLWEHPTSSPSLKHSKRRSSRALIKIAAAIRYAYLVEDSDPFDRDREEAPGAIKSLARNGFELSDFNHMSIPIFLWSLSLQSNGLMDLMLNDPIVLRCRDSKGQSLLHLVSKSGTLSMVKLIVRKFDDLDQPIDETEGYHCSLIHFAALNTDPAVMEYYLGLNSRDLDVNAPDIYDITPLHTAFAHNNRTVVRLLLEAGAKPDAKSVEGLTMLHCAARNVIYPEMIELCENHALNVSDAWNRTPLHLAAQFGTARAVQWLLDRGLKPSTTDDRGRTALHCACQNQSPYAREIITTLLENGASLTSTDHSDSTPLHLAFHDAEHASKYLFWTPYYKAYANNFSPAECERKVLTVLEGEGDKAFIDMQDSAGNTLLHLACNRSLSTIIWNLTELHARMDLPDARGFLPFELIQSGVLAGLVLMVEKARAIEDEAAEAKLISDGHRLDEVEIV